MRSVVIHNASDELAIKEGCRFDPEAARFVCDFIETFCKQSEDDWAGQPINLLPWQRDFLTRLFGWKRPDGTRRFKRAYVEIPKKNGKSTLLSGLACVLLLADAKGPKIYLNACDREQARIIYESAAAMIAQSPDLQARFKPIDSKNRIIYEDGFGVIIANSAVVDSKDGRNASHVIFDELHRQPNRHLWDVFKYAGAARKQFLLLSITTAGDVADGIWHEQREYSEAVNAGEIPDTTHLGIVYRARPDLGDDLDDPAVWARVNPSWGVTINPETFAREHAEARLVPTNWNNFCRLRLNVVASSSAKYFNMDQWESRSVAHDDSAGRLVIEDLAGLPTCIGLDLASVSDFTALAALAGDESTGYKLVTRFWVPEGQLVHLEKATGQPYRMWATKGFLTATPGERTDYAFVRAEINRIAAATKAIDIRCDPYNATQLCTQLAEEDGLPLKFLRQGFLSLNDPTKQFERLITEGKITHDNNPVMDWCMSNAIAETDAAGNIKISKSKSKHKIDGAAAAINAVAATLSSDAPAPYQGDGRLLL